MSAGDTEIKKMSPSPPKTHIGFAYIIDYGHQQLAMCLTF